MKIGQRIMLAAGALVCLVLLIQGSVSQVMIRNELKSVAVERLMDKVHDIKQSLVHLLHMTKQDMTMILANKAFEDYFNSKALEDDDGLLDSEFEIEAFFKKISQAKPQYRKIHLSTASLEPVLLIEGGRRYEHFHLHDHENAKQLVRRLRRNPEEVFSSSSVSHKLFRDKKGEWILLSVAAISFNEKVEGIVWVSQSIASYIKKAFKPSVNEGIYYTLSNEQGDFIAHSPDVEPEILTGLAREELADWLIASAPVPAIDLKISMGIQKERAFQIINKLSLVGFMVLVSALFFSIIILGLIARNISKPVRNLIEWTKKLSAGNLTVENFYHRNDEIGELGNAFKKMTEDLSRTVVSKEYVDNIIKSISHPFYVVDAHDYSIKLANPAADPSGKWRNTTCHSLTHKNDKPCEDKDHGCPLGVVKKTKRPVTLEHIHYDKEGKEKYYEVHGYPVFDKNGDVVQMIEYSIDITERKKAEEELKSFASKLEESNRELQDFAYIASHDLQEPLRKVTTFGDRLKAKYADCLEDQGREYLTRMQNAALRMHTLINDLLTYSRVTTKAQPFTATELSAIVNDVLSDLEVRIEQVDGRVEVGDLPTIEADPMQMRQLMQNLIGNALKFNKQDEAPVVKVYGKSSNGNSASTESDYHQITVEDNGIGFDEQYADRIFGVFQRLHGRSEYEGTGIGLSVCKKIVERHGGSITVKSRPGEGAAFTVTLPVKHDIGGG